MDKSETLPLDILLVEDNEVDIKVTLRAFDRAKMKNNVFVVRDGQEALDFINHRGDYADQAKFPRPDVILLDINMPRVNGFDFLEQVKRRPETKFIPVVMLTSSKNESDIVRSYGEGAASYIQKPVSYDDFVRIIDGFNTYWNVINKLPDGKRPS